MPATSFKALCLSILLGPQVLAEPSLYAVKTNVAPIIDGLDDEQVWKKAKAIDTTSFDFKVSLKSAYDKERIYFLVKFQDEDESRTHRTWFWDRSMEAYLPGHDREDTFVFKWPLDPSSKTFKVSEAHEHRADIWYWKAHRTDPGGFADDKIHIFNSLSAENATQINHEGKTYYLQRPGDKGTSAYKAIIPGNFTKEKVLNYKSREPSGSRSDILAKGVWRNGYWTVEFSRKLNTGHPDDIAFTQLSTSYNFGVSIFEIAGKKVKPNMKNNLYGAGEINDVISLRFEP